MNMDPRAFLDLAKRLLANENNPAGLRSAVSRAYYAAFHVAAEFLASIGHAIRKDANGHHHAYVFLHNCNDEFLVRIGGDLNDLRSSRNAADYQLHRQDVQREGNVNLLIEVAGEIIKVLDECTNGPAKRRKDVAKAIQDYKKKVGL